MKPTLGLLASLLVLVRSGTTAANEKAPTVKEQATLKGHTNAVWSVTWSPDGKTLASGSGDMTIKLWDTASGQERATLKGHTDWVISVAFSPDGKTLASGSQDQTIKLWDVVTGKEQDTLKGHT